MEKRALYSLIALLFVAFWLQKATAQDPESQTSLVYMSEGAIRAASVSTHYGDIGGNPYFYDGWSAGEARLTDGKIYKNLLLKYDEITGVIMFKYKLTDSAMAFVSPAVEFAFTYIDGDKPYNVHFLNGFAPADNASPLTYYQVLSNGNTKLLKRTVKNIRTHMEYGSSESKRDVLENTNYYIAKDMHPIKVNNSNKAVLAALSDKADRLKKFIDDNKLSAKNDDDFAKIVDYYNSI